MKKATPKTATTTRTAVKKTSLKDLSANQKAGTVKGGGRGNPVSGLK